jgi:hypothetical protein
VNCNIQPTLKKASDFTAARDSQEREIASVVHSLRDQACTLALGISALQYRDEPDQERQQYVAILESVVEEMNREFQRLDRWLMQVGYKPRLPEPARMVRGRQIKRQSVRA